MENTSFLSEDVSFLEYIEQQRDIFVNTAVKYTVSEHLELRTEIDSLLIAYDQMAEKLRVIYTNFENINSIDPEHTECSMCHGTGEYSYGGSFGGPTMTQSCKCGAKPKNILNRF